MHDPANKSAYKTIQRMMAAVIVVLAVLGSTVPACTCSHHEEQVKAEEVSCHSDSEAAAFEEVSLPFASVQTPCECIPTNPAPAIIAKSINENPAPKTDAILSGSQRPSFEGQLSIASAVPEIPPKPAAFLTSFHTRLLPARAPPRL